MLWEERSERFEKEWGKVAPKTSTLAFECGAD